MFFAAFILFSAVVAVAALGAVVVGLDRVDRHRRASAAARKR